MKVLPLLFLFLATLVVLANCGKSRKSTTPGSTPTKSTPTRGGSSKTPTKSPALSDRKINKKPPAVKQPTMPTMTIEKNVKLEKKIPRPEWDEKMPKIFPPPDKPETEKEADMKPVNDGLSEPENTEHKKDDAQWMVGIEERIKEAQLNEEPKVVPIRTQETQDRTQDRAAKEDPMKPITVTPTVSVDSNSPQPGAFAKPTKISAKAAANKAGGGTKASLKNKRKKTEETNNTKEKDDEPLVAKDPMSKESAKKAKPRSSEAKMRPSKENLALPPQTRRDSAETGRSSIVRKGSAVRRKADQQGGVEPNKPKVSVSLREDHPAEPGLLRNVSPGGVAAARTDPKRDAKTGGGAAASKQPEANPNAVASPNANAGTSPNQNAGTPPNANAGNSPDKKAGTPPNANAGTPPNQNPGNSPNQIAGTSPRETPPVDANSPIAETQGRDVQKISANDLTPEQRQIAVLFQIQMRDDAAVAKPAAVVEEPPKKKEEKRDSKESKDKRDSKESKDRRDSKESKDRRDSKESKKRNRTARRKAHKNKMGHSNSSEEAPGINERRPSAIKAACPQGPGVGATT